MKYLKKTVLSLVITIVIIPHCYPQSSINIHFGPSIPISHFSHEDFTSYQSQYKVTAAPKIGITAGLKNVYKLPDRKFGFFMELDFFYHKPNNEYRDSVFNWNPPSFYPYPLSNLEVKKIQDYYNIPITLGFDYQYPIFENLLLDIDIGISLNFMKLSDFVYKFVPLSTKRRETDWSYRTGVKMGIGTIVRNRYSLNLNYFGLGKHKIAERYSTRGWVYLPELNVHFLTISTGISF